MTSAPVPANYEELCTGQLLVALLDVAECVAPPILLQPNQRRSQAHALRNYHALLQRLRASYQVGCYIQMIGRCGEWCQPTCAFIGRYLHIAVCLFVLSFDPSFLLPWSGALFLASTGLAAEVGLAACFLISGASGASGAAAKHGNSVNNA